MSPLFGSKTDALIFGHPCRDNYYFKIYGALTSSNSAAIATHRIGATVQQCKMMMIPPALKHIGALALAIGVMF